MATIENVNKFRYAFDSAPKSATHFNGSEYGHMRVDEDGEVFVSSLTVPDCMYIKNMEFITTPLPIIEMMALMMEGKYSEHTVLENPYYTKPKT